MLGIKHGSLGWHTNALTIELQEVRMDVRGLHPSVADLMRSGNKKAEQSEIIP